MDGSSDWSGRGSRSRDSSTSLSKRDKREQFDELKGMIQTLAVVFKTPLQQQLQLLVVKNEVVTIGEHVKKVATKVDTFEEKVSAKRMVEKTNSRVERVEGATQEHAKKIQQMKEEMAKINAGVGSAERLTRRRKTMKHETGGGERGQWTPSFISLNGWWIGTGRWRR